MRKHEEILRDVWDEWFDGAVIEPTLEKFMLELMGRVLEEHHADYDLPGEDA